MVAVCSRLGYPDESVTVVGLHELATGSWDPFSVVILVRSGRAGDRRVGRGATPMPNPWPGVFLTMPMPIGTGS